jgi:hypothetical protein
VNDHYHEKDKIKPWKWASVARKKFLLAKGFYVNLCGIGTGGKARVKERKLT